MFWQKQKTDFFRDITSLGGALFYFLITYLFFAIRQDHLAWKLFVGFFIIYCTAVIIRLFYFKNRPKKETYHSIPEKIDASSFPSIHSARATFMLLSIIDKTSSLYAERLPLIIIWAYVCYSRIVIKKHDWIDVFSGVGLGIITLYVVHAIL